MKKLNNNRMRYKRIIAFAIPLLVISSCCDSCTSDPKDPFQGLLDNSKVVDYVNEQNSSMMTADAPFSIYLDMSSGIFKAYEQIPENGRIVKAILTKIGEQERCNQIYELFDNTLNVDRAHNKTDHYYISDNYAGIYAPIEMAVDSIVARNEDAILITDFEEYRKGDGIIYSKDLYTKAFTNWLGLNNQIDVFYLDEVFEDGDASGKRLFFTVFSTANGNQDLLKDVENKIGDVNHFTINKNNWTLNPFHKGGVTDCSMVSYLKKWPGVYIDGKDNIIQNPVKNDKYEIIYLKDNGLTKKDSEKLKDKIEKNSLGFLDSIYVDFTANKIYDLKDLKVEVYNVTEDYKFYQKCHIIDSVSKYISMTKDEKENDVWDQKSMNGALNLIQAGYEKNTSDKKAEFDYNRESFPKKELEEFVAIDTEILENTRKSDATKARLKINFHENFTKDKLANWGIIKIDIKIEEVSYNNSVNTALSWTSNVDGAKKKNTSFNTSIINVIESTEKAINDGDQTLYSVYLVNTNNFKNK